MPDSSYVIVDTATGQQRPVKLIDNGDGTFSLGFAFLHRLAGEDLENDLLRVESKYAYKNITTATTDQVKIGPGVLHAIVVNSTAAATIKIIDGTSGTTANIGTLKASIPEGTYKFDLAFESGLRIITAGASDITVIYR